MRNCPRPPEAITNPTKSDLFSGLTDLPTAAIAIPINPAAANPPRSNDPIRSKEFDTFDSQY